MKRRPLLAFFALTFGLTWGLGACFALFPAQLTAVFGKVSVTNPLFILAVYAPSISAIVVTGRFPGSVMTVDTSNTWWPRWRHWWRCRTL